MREYNIHIRKEFKNGKPKVSILKLVLTGIERSEECQK